MAVRARRLSDAADVFNVLGRYGGKHISRGLYAVYHIKRVTGVNGQGAADDDLRVALGNWLPCSYLHAGCFPITRKRHSPPYWLLRSGD